MSVPRKGPQEKRHETRETLRTQHLRRHQLVFGQTVVSVVSFKGSLLERSYHTDTDYQLVNRRTSTHVYNKVTP